MEVACMIVYVSDVSNIFCEMTVCVYVCFSLNDEPQLL